MDSTYTFQLQTTLNINQSITITSFGEPQEQTTINSNAYFPVFNLSAHVIFKNIHILYYKQSKKIGTHFFHINEDCKKLTVINCAITFVQGLPFDFTYEHTFELEFRDTLFYGIDNHKSHDHEPHNFKVEINTVSPKDGATIKKPHVIITFHACSLLNTFITICRTSCGKVNLTISDSHFNTTKLFTGSLNGSITNNIFKESSLEINEGASRYSSLEIKRNTFKGSFFCGNLNDFAFQLNITSSKSAFCSIEKCSFQEATCGALNLQSIDTRILNSNFSNNTILDTIGMPRDRAAALTSSSGTLRITGSHFLKNSAPTNQAGAIHAQTSGGDIPTFSFQMYNTSIVNGIYKISRHDNPLILNPTQENARLTIQNTEIDCQNGQYITSQKVFGTYLTVSCLKCDSTEYNALAKRVSDVNIWEMNKQNANIKCHPCPFQTTCIGGIKSKGNYWGFSNENGEVFFYLCPTEYCCLDSEQCKSYNTCNKNRKGRLCSDCIEEHVLSLFSQNKCVHYTECKNSIIIWVGYVIGVVLISLFFLYNTDLWEFLKTTAVSKMKKNDDNDKEGEDEGENHSEEDDRNEIHSYQLLQDENEIQPKKSNISGLIKITFFFYQTASIIRISASAKLNYQMPAIISILTSFFNIKIDVTSSNNDLDFCPFHTQNIIIMEVFRSSLVVSCILVILLAILVCFITTKCTRWLKENTQPNYRKAFMNRLKGAYVNLLLLGYANITVFCLQSVNCIDINGDFFLYTKASIQCLRVWQNVVQVFTFLYIVPFPMVVYIGCRYLRSYQITTNTFLILLTFPPSALYLFLIRPYIRDENTDSPHFNPTDIYEASTILNVLNEPFRKFEINKKRLIWEPVLISRRLLLASITTFIISPITKLYIVGLMLVLFTIHDYITKPFTQQNLNSIQFISMMVLILLAILNMFWAYSNDIDVKRNEELNLMGEAFLIIELIILLVPIVIFCYYVIKKLFKLFSKCCKCC